jgi:hypothetical protein
LIKAGDCHGKSSRLAWFVCLYFDRSPYCLRFACRLASNKALSPPGWRTIVAEIAYIQAPPHTPANPLGVLRIDYEYKVAGEEYGSSIFSVPIYASDTLAFYNKYREGKTIVAYNPAQPSESRATEIASDYASASCLGYLVAFCLAFTFLTLWKIGAAFGAQRKLNERRSVARGLLESVRKRPVQISTKR